MNALAKIQDSAIEAWTQENPWAAMRGIDEPTWNALSSTIYPGAKPESILMAVDYCRARDLDPMLKPVHLVPMNVKDAITGNKEYRDVPMPGIGLYRIQADRSGTYAGADEPEFGPIVERKFKGKYSEFTVCYPEWCKYTVHKMIGSHIVAFIAKEFWIENYATESNTSDAPNSMWKKRPYAQLSKCAEAQALRKGWPEIGQDVTAEEMEGKDYIRDVTPVPQAIAAPAVANRKMYPQDRFDTNLPKWTELIESGEKTAKDIIATVESKGDLTDSQRKAITDIKKGESHEAA